MNELFNKIYENVICYEADFITMSRDLDAEINLLLSQHLDRFNGEELELIKCLMYQTSNSAKQKGFKLGAKYAHNSILELNKK